VIFFLPVEKHEIYMPQLANGCIADHGRVGSVILIVSYFFCFYILEDFLLLVGFGNA